MLTSRSDRTRVSESRFVGSHRLVERPDLEDVETLSDAEQLCRVSCPNRRTNIADTDRPLQETVENAYAGLPESIIISSALEIVPPPDDVELPKSALAFEPVQAVPVYPFSITSTPLSSPTGGSNTLVSKKAKKSKKDTKA